MARATALLFVVGVLALYSRAVVGEAETVQVGVKFRPEDCETKAVDGDYVGVHYVGKLADGTEFDNSITRGEPIEFRLGAQQVIPGWEQGIMGMCVGEKRRLQIPPSLAYGDDGVGPIPGGATLVFDVELVRISAESQGGGEDGGGGGGYEDYPNFGGDAEGDQVWPPEDGSAHFGGGEGYGDGEGGEPEWE